MEWRSSGRNSRLEPKWLRDSGIPPLRPWIYFEDAWGLATLWITKQKAKGSMRGSPEPLAWRSRLELLESASPIAFAEHQHFSNEQFAFQ